MDGKSFGLLSTEFYHKGAIMSINNKLDLESIAVDEIVFQTNRHVKELGRDELIYHEHTKIIDLSEQVHDLTVEVVYIYTLPKSQYSRFFTSSRDGLEPAEEALVESIEYKLNAKSVKFGDNEYYFLNNGDVAVRRSMFVNFEIYTGGKIENEDIHSESKAQA